MVRYLLFACVIVSIGGLSVSALGDQKTSVPLIYILDYSEHLSRVGEFAGQVGEAPPYLLHVAHDGPFVNSWGALELDTAQPIPPAEMEKRFGDVRKMVTEVRKSGVKIVIPYICNQTIAGDPEKRLGIWWFYDNWDNYSRFGLGSKPMADPIDWLARQPDGQPHFNYEKRHKYFARFGYYRFAPCVNNPYYNEYLRGIVTTMAAVNFDGVFVDNCILNCYCEHCQRRFREYLGKKYSPTRLAKRFGVNNASRINLGTKGNRYLWSMQSPDFAEFLRTTVKTEELIEFLGTDDPAKANLPEGGNGWLWMHVRGFEKYLREKYSEAEFARKYGPAKLEDWGIVTPEDRALWAETKLFWADSIRENLKKIQRWTSEIKRGFYIVPNWGAMQWVNANHFRSEIGHDLRIWAEACDMQMFEEDAEPGMIAPGVYLDYILQYKYALACGTRAGVLHTVADQLTCELSHAEAAAGGGGAFMQPGYNYPEIRRKYATFYDEYRSLFDGNVSVADVALAYFYDELHMGNLDHIEQVYKLTRYLADQHILFEYVTETDLAREQLGKYKVLILPGTRYLSAQQVAAVESFLVKGGAVVCTGKAGDFDEDARPRPASPFTGPRPGVHALLHAESLGSLLPEDRLSREEALMLSRSGSVRQNMDVPGDPRYALLRDADYRIGIDRYLDGGKLLEFMNKHAGHDLRVADPRQAMGVRFNAYRPERPDRIRTKTRVHAVNYNVPIAGDPKDRKLAPVENIELTVRTPREHRNITALLFRPGAEAENLEVKRDTVGTHITIPRLDIYAIISVETAP